MLSGEITLHARQLSLVLVLHATASSATSATLTSEPSRAFLPRRLESSSSCWRPRGKARRHTKATVRRSWQCHAFRQTCQCMLSRPEVVPVRLERFWPQVLAHAGPCFRTFALMVQLMYQVHGKGTSSPMAIVLLAFVVPHVAFFSAEQSHSGPAR